MRIAAVADLHGHLPVVPTCDLLILAGDLSNALDFGIHAQFEWLSGTFSQWLDDVPAETAVAIAGNHDFALEERSDELSRSLRWHYLEAESATVAGVTLWGSPWTPQFHGLAFNAPAEDGESFLRGRFDGAMAETDVIVLHGPPHGYGDVAPDGASVGSYAALELIDRVRPQLCVFGHIHGGRGSWQRGNSLLANVSAVDENYALRDSPVALFEI